MFKKLKAGFESLKAGLARTHNAIMGSVESAFNLNNGESREELFERLEESLITSDVGVKASMEIVGNLRTRLVGWDTNKFKEYFRESIYDILKEVEKPLEIDKNPFVIMVLGVNGVGKTTTIGKLAARYKAEGKSVLLAAGDTFRAAAIEQLEGWGNRVGCDVIRQAQGGDPGAVIFDAIRAAQSRRSDVIILDTAGRLHTKVNLMEELKKVQRVVSREMPGAPHENLLVLDASTGQNAINQAKLFDEAVGVTGIALTKLDGTAKGGIIVAIAKEMKIPIRFIGVGETVDDLKDFDAHDFVEALI
ncbi:MAG: signal recognition particle-docking protein FtsY [Deltaproteobacteria bacterium]|nr:signal recognition particle-docking protein FtsY [Deltaproteobacteria bacterium]